MKKIGKNEEKKILDDLKGKLMKKKLKICKEKIKRKT